MKNVLMLAPLLALFSMIWSGCAAQPESTESEAQEHVGAVQSALPMLYDKAPEGSTCWNIGCCGMECKAPDGSIWLCARGDRNNCEMSDPPP